MSNYRGDDGKYQVDYDPSLCEWCARRKAVEAVKVAGVSVLLNVCNICKSDIKEK